MSGVIPAIADFTANTMMGNEQPVDYFGSGYGGPYQARPDLGPNVGFGSGLPMPGYNPVADQTQQQIANPIYGQSSPFQPPMPAQGIPPVQAGGVSGGGKTMDALNEFNLQTQAAGGMPMMEPYQPNPLQGTPMQRPGQLVGGPVGRPIIGQPGGVIGGSPQRRGQLVGGPVGRPIVNQPGQPGGVIGGGLKPAPRNYRPPVRRMR